MIACLVLGLAFEAVFYSFNAVEKQHDQSWKTHHRGLG
jgi:hypothetical protein